MKARAVAFNIDKKLFKISEAMKSEQLEQVREACKQQLLDTLMTLVRENGTDYNDYRHDERSIDEDEGYTITKVLDIASFGCCVALPLKFDCGIESDIDPTPQQIADEYGCYNYRALYIECDMTDYETLMIYSFYNDGVNRQSVSAEPAHSPASEMSLAELDYLTQAIYWHLRRDVEKVKDNDRLPEVTEPEEMEFYSIEPDGQDGKQIHLLGYIYWSDDHWVGVEPSFLVLPLREFIDQLKKEEGYTDRLLSEAKLYEGDYDDVGAVDYINHYFDGHTANRRLHYSEITIGTPCGDYIA